MIPKLADKLKTVSWNDVSLSEVSMGICSAYREQGWIMILDLALEDFDDNEFDELPDAKDDVGGRHFQSNSKSIFCELHRLCLAFGSLEATECLKREVRRVKVLGWGGSIFIATPKLVYQSPPCVYTNLLWSLPLFIHFSAYHHDY